jgi:excisionase family DNA binding protein
MSHGGKFLQLGRNAVYDAIGRGEIPHRRIGRAIRLSRAALVRWLGSWSSQDAKEGQ